jgi:predicted peptidase
LKAVGSPVKYTEYPEAQHDSWTVTYSNPELYAWLFSQRRESK